jgi:hypothetical protein
MNTRKTTLDKLQHRLHMLDGNAATRRNVEAGAVNGRGYNGNYGTINPSLSGVEPYRRDTRSTSYPHGSNGPTRRSVTDATPNRHIITGPAMEFARFPTSHNDTHLRIQEAMMPPRRYPDRKLHGIDRTPPSLDDMREAAYRADLAERVIAYTKYHQCNRREHRLFNQAARLDPVHDGNITWREGRNAIDHM